MMNYFTGILSFLERGPRSNRGLTLPAVQNDTTSQSASCRGWSIPDPDVHLRLSDNRTVRIFGYPNEEDIPPEMEIPFVNIGNGGSPLLYLRGDIPAHVSYIMGEDWRSRLRDDHHTSNTHIFCDGEVILRPSTTTSPSQESQEDLEASERAHCLRMRRCGAVAVRSEVDIIFEETGGEHRPNHLFGWPASGGVWILRSCPIDHLRQQSDMDELCRLLKEAGGQFYSNIEDCPEVKKLRLLN